MTPPRVSIDVDVSVELHLDIEAKTLTFIISPSDFEALRDTLKLANPGLDVDDAQVFNVITLCYGQRLGEIETENSIYLGDYQRLFIVADKCDVDVAVVEP